MNRMVCEDCGTIYYSAAARVMVERGERCSKCGGKLLLMEGPKGHPDDRGRRPRRRGPQLHGGSGGGAA